MKLETEYSGLERKFSKIKIKKKQLAKLSHHCGWNLASKVSKAKECLKRTLQSRKWIKGIQFDYHLKWLEFGSERKPSFLPTLPMLNKEVYNPHKKRFFFAYILLVSNRRSEKKLIYFRVLSSRYQCSSTSCTLKKKFFWLITAKLEEKNKRNAEENWKISIINNSQKILFVCAE